ncbi:MAG: mechanosensitive ion channel family protein [Polyangiaceae bacterium]|nr:mechanosensitive ion channel family protein [Polyangiaceae bacterium]
MAARPAARAPATRRSPAAARPPTAMRSTALRPLALRSLAFVLAFALALLAAVGRPGLAAAQTGDDAPDRVTPRRSVEGFLDAAHRGQYTRAAQYLDLRGVPNAKAAGPELARKLAEVIDQQLYVDLSRLSDSPQGEPKDGADVDLLGVVLLSDRSVPVTLAPVRVADGSPWLFSKATVSDIPDLYEAHSPGELERRVPRPLKLRLGALQAWQWLGLLAAALLSSFVSLLVAGAVLRLAALFARRTNITWDEETSGVTRGPTRMLLAVALAETAVPWLDLPARASYAVDNVAYSLMIFGVAWLLIRAVRIAAGVIDRRATAEAFGDSRARAVRTHIVILRKVTALVIGFVALSIGLLRFEFVRNLGVSLLASAGIAGVVLGLAAQKTVGNLVAGLQLSITQPVRLGDGIVMEGEFGTVEEIRLSYVVVRLWDERRLVVPVSKFLESSFQNWTRGSTELLGTVFFYVDQGAPVAALRAKLIALCETNVNWDRRVCKLQVTDMNDRAMVLRALVSAANADRLFTLRVELREELITFLQGFEGGRHFVRDRTQLVDSPERAPLREPDAIGPGRAPSA